MEETIGYEALFSAEEWDALMSGDRSGPDDWGAPKEGESQTAAMSGCINRASTATLSPFTTLNTPSGRKHSVFIGNPPGQYEGNDERYELECDVCDYIGAADTAEEAQAIARLHEAFVATLVEKWSVDR